MLGIAVDGSGRVYACDAGNGEVVRIDPLERRIEVYARGPGGRDLDTPNAMAFDAEGSLYITCSGEDGAPAIVRASPGEGSATTWSRDVPGYPNGCLVEPDGRGLVVVEAHAQRLVQRADPRGRLGGSAVGPRGASRHRSRRGCARRRRRPWVTLYRPDGLVRVVSPLGP